MTAWQPVNNIPFIKYFNLFASLWEYFSQYFKAQRAKVLQNSTVFISELIRFKWSPRIPIKVYVNCKITIINCLFYHYWLVIIVNQLYNWKSQQRLSCSISTISKWKLVTNICCQNACTKISNLIIWHFLKEELIMDKDRPWLCQVSVLLFLP